MYKYTRRFALRAFASLQVTDFIGLTRRSSLRITLRVCGCGSLPAHICIATVGPAHPSSGAQGRFFFVQELFT